MDDIQFWLYILFAVIYFIFRGLKKREPQKTEKRPQTETQTQEKPQRKPVSFEELLKEFTEEKEKPVHETSEEDSFGSKGTDYQSVKKLAQEEQEQPFEEGRTRRFSDEESRKVYEESIAQAEGTSLEFERDEHFKSSIQRAKADEGKNVFAKEIRDMLSSPDDARKAIVLSEILNRKY